MSHFYCRRAAGLTWLFVKALPTSSAAHAAAEASAALPNPAPANSSATGLGRRQLASAGR